MRWTSIFFRNAREPQNENKVPFKAMLPLKLRDRVSSKNQKVTGMFLYKKIKFIIIKLLLFL